MLIHLDESGDLGWTFDAPYQAGGSSRYLTIAALCVDSDVKHLPKRIIKGAYQKFGWPTSTEVKWSDMDLDEKVWFATEASGLERDKKPAIRYLSMTAKKENVQDHIRADPNKLYNYMIGLLLIKVMAPYDEVHLFPDARSMKVGSGNSLHDYLQTKLWFDKNAKTKLTTTPCDSAGNRNVQFADMISGVVQGHFENGSSEPWNILRSQIGYRTLFF